MAESLDWFEKAIATLGPVHEAQPLDVTARQFLVNSHASRAQAFDLRQNFAEAIEDWDKAIALTTPDEQRPFRVNRAKSRLQAGMVVEAVAEIDELTKTSNWNADQWYNFACVYAVASGQSADKKAEYADRAMEFLTTAVEAGCNDAAHIEADTDLDPLREREDFKKLLAELEKKFQPMQEVIPPPKEGIK